MPAPSPRTAGGRLESSFSNDGARKQVSVYVTEFSGCDQSCSGGRVGLRRWIKAPVPSGARVRIASRIFLLGCSSASAKSSARRARAQRLGIGEIECAASAPRGSYAGGLQRSASGVRRKRVRVEQRTRARTGRGARARPLHARAILAWSAARISACVESCSDQMRRLCLPSYCSQPETRNLCVAKPL